MGVRDIFSHKKKLSQRKFGRLYSKDSRMGEVFGNQKIAKALDKTSERNEFYDALKKKKEGGVTKQEMKEVLGEWMTGKGRTISRKEAYAVAKEFFGDERVKYVMPKKKTSFSGAGGGAGAFGGGGGQYFQKSSGFSGNAQTSASGTQRNSFYPKTSGSGQIIYKKAPAGGQKKPIILVSSAQKNSASSSANAQTTAQSDDSGSAAGAQSASQKKDDSKSKKEAQSKARRKSISAGLAAIVDMMGPVKSDDKKNKKGDFFRAMNSTIKRGRG